MKRKLLLLLLSVMVMGLMFNQGSAFAKKDDDKPLKPVPKAYANKHMPKGWWTDPKIIAEGKKIFETTRLEYVYKRKKRVAKKGCLTCHGINKKKDRPKKRGARDFRVGKRMNRFSDSYWLWRVSEGVKKTSMPSWKKKLTEEEIWKTIAYEHTWSHGHKPAVHDHKEIEFSVEK
ncbi:MAG: c-type cytochrome [Nitrospiria bacterium]